MTEDKIIVSFTTWRRRDKFVPRMLESLLKQTLKPDKIILWLSEDEYHGMTPEHLKKCVDNGSLTDIRFVKGNTKCYKRWEIFKEYDDAYIVMVDDDFYYPEDYIEKLYKTAKEHQCPCCYFEKTIDYTGTDRVEIKYNPSDIRNYLYPGFCCIPPGIIKKDNELFGDDYVKLRDTYNPISDDLWYNVWFKKQGISIYGVRKWQNDIVRKCQIAGTQKDGLWERTNRKSIDGVSNVVRNFATLVEVLGEQEMAHKLYPHFNIEKCSNKEYIDKELNKSVSIIMSAYKSQRFIKKAIDSIYSQTYFQNHNNWELLIGIDNCEDTLNYLKSIMHLYDEHLRVFMMDSNKGTYITSNTLLQLSKYNWIMRFDSDDALKKDAIEILFKKSEGYDCCVYKYDIVNADMSNCSSAKQSIPYHNGSIFVKASVIKYLGGYAPWPVSADADLIHCRIEKFYRVNHIDESLLYYRVHNESLSHSAKTNGKTEIRKKYNNIWKNKNLTDIKDAIIPCETNTYKEIVPNDICMDDYSDYTQVIYTYTNNDYISEAQMRIPGYKYICFSNKNITSDTWDIRQIPSEISSLKPEYQKEMLKICPHIYLPEYSESIWIDSSDKTHEICKLGIFGLDKDKSVHMKNSRRDCIYKEFMYCLSHKLDSEFNIRSCLFKYQKMEYSSKLGLPDTSIIIRSHNDPYCVNLMELWKNETINKTKLDQLTLPYCLTIIGDSKFEYIKKK